MKLPDLDGWIPARVLWRENQPDVEWLWIGRRRFSEPFFSDTLNCAIRNPFTLLFRHLTPIQVLEEWRSTQPGLPLSGLIFHMSRCGSTLISQLLSASPQSVVLSEPPPLDALLRARGSEEQRSLWVQWMVSALGQKRSGEETRLFLKLDCWHMPYLPILRRAFPTAPWIFLYRDPLEVLASHQTAPALWSVPGIVDTEWLRAEHRSLAITDRIEFCARVLEHVCEAAWAVRGDPLGKLVHYRELPEAIWTGIADHFNMTFSAADVDEMRQKARFNAKIPRLCFENDSGSKRMRASAQTSWLAQNVLGHVYNRLEQARHEFELQPQF